MKKLNNGWPLGGGGQRSNEDYQSNILRSEKGIVLLVVIVLSAVALTIMTALIYMISSGTQVSGLQKGYRTAVEAGVGGGEVLKELISLRGEPAGTDTFKTALESFNMNPALTTAPTCSGSLVSGATYTALAAKIITPSSSWVGCDTTLSIDPAVSSSYDMKIEMGTTTKFNVYAKIVSTIEGNSGGGGETLLNQGVVSTGEVQVMQIPYLYSIEVLGEHAEGYGERARLSILYQY